MKYYIIAGEASGDLHASNLILEIKKLDHNAVIRGWGGDLMEMQGAEIVKHYRDLAFMGYIEVLLNLRTIINNLKFCKADIQQFQPDVLILVDYPGFNLRIAAFAHSIGLKVHYYISPQIWAWHKNRIHSIKKVVDKMLVILPFEQEFYKKHGMEVTFVGHPLIDALQLPRQGIDEFHQFLSEINRPIIALLPGSRKQEISRMLKVMVQMPAFFPDYQFIIAGAPSVAPSFYEKACEGKDVKIVFGHTYNLLGAAKAAIVTSGTATLETALMGVPEVVCYRGSRISYEIAKRLIDIKFISLVNLIMDRKVVSELIQNNMNTYRLKNELELLINDAAFRSTMLSDFSELKNKLGGIGASAKAAQIVVDDLV